MHGIYALTRKNENQCFNNKRLILYAEKRENIPLWDIKIAGLSIPMQEKYMYTPIMWGGISYQLRHALKKETDPAKLSIIKTKFELVQNGYYVQIKQKKVQQLLMEMKKL